MPSLFEQYQPFLDETVDSVLGDTILLSTGAGFAPVMGFVIVNGQGEGGFGEMDSLIQKKRIKIAKEALADPYAPAVRFQHPRLGAGSFRLSSDNVAEEGRYWLLDVQKASV